MLVHDLEALTGNLISGDITPIVIGLFKDTKYKKDLLKYVHFCSDRQLREQLRGVAKIDFNKKLNTIAKQEDNSGPSLAQWITGRGVDLPLSGKS